MGRAGGSLMAHIPSTVCQYNRDQETHSIHTTGSLPVESKYRSDKIVHYTSLS
jgi:hypothetical protein